jgi:hypothetical protein
VDQINHEAASSSVAAIETEKVPDGLDREEHAILVLHGIGQQHPFEVLDNVTRGLTKTIGFDRIDHHHIVHVTHGADVPFDHSMVVTYRDDHSKQHVTLHIFEYFWASKTAGKASFLDILKWIRITALTPVQRFAFNMPLILERVGHERSGWKYLGSLGYQLAREIWRIIYIPVVCLGIAAFAAYLMLHSAELGKHLFDNLKTVILPQPETTTPMPPDVQATGLAWLLNWMCHVFVFLFAIIGLGQYGPTVCRILGLLLACGASIGVIGIALSLPSQIRDVCRTEAWTEGRTQGFWRLTSNALRERGKQSMPHILHAAWKASGKEDRQISIEIPAHRWLLFLSFAALLLLGGIIYWLVTTPSGIRMVSGIEWPRFVSPIVLLFLGWALKVAVVDYIGDIALYATADEDSTFFAIRRQILDEATQKLRWLLRQKQMTSIAIAGHSLGSVIAYDAIGWLRVETQGTPVPVSPPADSPAASTSPVSADEFQKIRTFITFGSPLNKVVYFFRTKLPPYQTIRAYILNEIHGFRRVSEHHTDPLVRDANGAPLPDTLLWVNVSAPFDLISARLVFFTKIREYRRMYMLPIFCHLSYWNDDRFYRIMLNAVVRQGNFSQDGSVRVKTERLGSGQ